MAKHETTIKLKADNQTGRAFRTAEKDMKRTDKAASSLAGSLRAVGGLLGAAGGLSLVKGALDSTDALQKTSIRLGITTDRLQELGFAASQSGIEFNTVTMGMQRFGRRLAEAADGGGAAKDALIELNIATRNTDGTLRDVDSAFTEAVNKLGQMESGAKKTSLAFKLFDSEGVRLVQFGDKLDSLSARARALGLVIDRELIDKAAEVNDQFDVLSRVMDTQFKSAMLNGITVTQDFGTWLGKASVAADDMLASLVGEDRDVSGSLEEAQKFLAGLADESKAVEKNTDKTANNLKLVVDNTRTAAAQAEAFAEAFDIASDRTDTIASNLAGIQGIGEERDQKPATVLGALTKSSRARGELQKGNVEKASELALQAAEELRQVEEDTGKNVALAGTFIKNFEKIAQDALNKAEGQQEALKLVIEITGQDAQTFDFTKEGVKKAGDDTTKRLKAAEKKRA